MIAKHFVKGKLSNIDAFQYLIKSMNAATGSYINASLYAPMHNIWDNEENGVLFWKGFGDGQFGNSIYVVYVYMLCTPHSHTHTH